MKPFLFIFLSCLLLLACKPEQQNENLAFDAFKETFIENLWELYPGWASAVGFHKYDSILVIPDARSREKEIAFARENLNELSQFDVLSLSDNNQTDYYLIKNELERIEWEINEEKSFEWNPAVYNVSGGFAEMLVNDYDSLDTRLHHFGMKLRFVPAYYSTAKQNISNPTTPHTQLAIAQNLGGVSVFERDLKVALEQSGLPDTEKQEIAMRADEAVSAMKGYADWLKDLDNPSPRSFRLGKNLYQKKFALHIQSDYTVEEIYEKAVARKDTLHAKMLTVAEALWPEYMGDATKPSNPLAMIKQVIDKISLTHVEPDSFQSAIEKQIPQLVSFVSEKDLLYLDPSKPLVVRREPAYMAGVAGASISAPGPYDKEGNTFYNVGSLAGWESDRAESYLREYNHYMLQVLNIHEAVPGHYAQLVYSNQSPSIVKSILGNGAMIEGWAVYSELMMMENGYGNNEPELWLMYYKWNLRATCNTILDIGVHSRGMTEAEAMHLLVDEAFQEEAEARGKWNRVSVTSVQLCSYFTGFMEICDLRETLKMKQGDRFNLKAFHEQFLSYGSAPVKYIRSLMLAGDGDQSSVISDQ